MNKSLVLITLAALLNQFVCGASLLAQENKEPAGQKAASSIQQQIDDLKEGQQRMLKELAEIKKLLQDRTNRVDGAKPAMPNAISLNVHGEPFKGGNGARVAIVEYSDFDCSFCAKYATEIYPLIDENYIKPGKIKYFFRDLPSPEHPNALFKARLARCAGEQGKFWEMHDRLFANQSAVDGQDLAPYAQTVGLDAEQLRQCLAGERYTENIRRSMYGAARMGIRGTPAFLIGTVTADGDFLRTTNVFLGAESYAAVKSILDELLAPPKPSSTK